MTKTPLKKVIKSKIKANKELTKEEKLREKMKYEIATELGLKDKVDKLGGRTNLRRNRKNRGIMTKRKKELKLPKNEEILKMSEDKNNI